MFKDAAALESVVWEMKLADYPRGLNRARINSLANGDPPYTPDQEQKNNIEINVSDLGLTRLAHDARQQMTNAYDKPGNCFTCKTDMGPVHRRQMSSSVVTKEVNRIIKRSLSYYETRRSKFALNILHGIGPSTWGDRESWCPEAVGIEDVLIPSGTLLSMKNLPLFAIFRSYTAMQLRKLTSGPKVDPAWRMSTVKACLDWADQEMVHLRGNTWPEVWSPEKMSERIKENSGLYAADSVPTIDTWDVYYWNDSGKQSGWNRRIILDSVGTPDGQPSAQASRITGDRHNYLYNPGTRKYGDKLSEILHFQFADLSAVAPFRYHSVRSLGWLLYAVCHLQNRLRCKFNEAVFEGLLMYMRVKTLDEAERALKIELAQRGIIDDTVQFLSPAERWQVNERLAELGLRENQQIIQENSSSWVQNQNYSSDRTEKTKFQVMAEVNAMTTLISAGLQQSYKYEEFQYQEIFRRFCIKNSRDGDVREFRLRCLKRGVPEELLVPEAWELESERILGAGNKTMEMQIAGQLMEWRNLYDPEPQRDILRQATLAITDSAALANALVPEKPLRVSDSVHDAQTGLFAALMMGARVDVKTGVNHIETVETLLVEMALVVKRILVTGGVPDPRELTGLQNLAQHISQHIAIIGQDKNEKQRARAYQDDLGNLMNEVKAFAQRLQEKMQADNGNAGLSAEDLGQIEADKIKAAAKAANMRESHAARTQQKEVSWELEQRRKEQQHGLDMRKEIQRTQIETAVEDMKTAADIQRDRTKPSQE
jgi:hypothetical protein